MILFAIINIIFHTITINLNNYSRLYINQRPNEAHPRLDFLQSINQYVYKRDLGAFRPKFQGIHEDYYPLSTSETLLYSLYVIALIGSVLGIMIGFLFWVTNINLTNYVVVWCIVFLVFLSFLIVGFFINGRGREKKNS